VGGSTAAEQGSSTWAAMTRSTAIRYGRREFLVRSGIMGAALVLLDAPGALDATSVGATTTSAVAPIFDALATDTINGLIAFAVPGPDPYSVVQGVSDTAPGGIDAGGTAFMLNALDGFYPVPQEPLRLLVQSLTTGLPANLPGLPGLPVVPGLAEELDLALAALLADKGTVPLSLVAALLLNFVATLINPTVLTGSFLSPFSRLTFAEKTQVFAFLEGEASTVAAMIDTNLTEPARSSISGLLLFLSGALVEFAAFGSYSEFGVFDPTTRTLSGTPVGWTLSQYLALAPSNRPVEGWDEFKGYLGGITEATP
jgi:hypothetical protein